MLILNYTVEKEGMTFSTLDRLMINERQINDLMDSLVAYGFDVVEMSVSPAKL